MQFHEEKGLEEEKIKREYVDNSKEKEKKRVPFRDLLNKENFKKERQEIIIRNLDIKLDTAKEKSLADLNIESEINYQKFFLAIEKVVKDKKYRFESGTKIFNLTQDQLAQEEILINPAEKKILAYICAHWEEINHDQDNLKFAREELKNLHHERFLQSGARLFDILTILALENSDWNEDQLFKNQKKYFKDNQLPFSRDQEQMLYKAVILWQEAKKKLNDRVFNNFEDIILKSSLGDKKVPQSLKEWEEFINNEKNIFKIEEIESSYKKLFLQEIGSQNIFGLGGIPVVILGVILENIEIDFSRYPFVIVKIKNKKVWDVTGNQGLAGFFYPEKIEKGTNLLTYYVLTDSDYRSKEEIKKTQEHEFWHAIRHNIFNQVKNQIIAQKTNWESSHFEKDLAEIEKRLGARFDPNEYKNIVPESSLKNIQEKIEEKDKRTYKEKDPLGKEKDPVTERDFWHIVQEETLSRLKAGQNVSQIQGYIRPLVTKEIGEQVMKKSGLIEKEHVRQFNRFHDTLMFYYNAGAEAQKLADVIVSSTSFIDAQRRIKNSFELNPEAIKRALDSQKSFRYLDFKIIFEAVEKYDQEAYFLKKLNKERVESIFSNLNDQRNGFYNQLTDQSRLNREEEVLEAIERIGDYIKKKEILKKLSLNKVDLEEALENVVTLNIIKQPLSLKKQFLEIIDESTLGIREFVLRKLIKGLNGQKRTLPTGEEILVANLNQTNSFEKLQNAVYDWGKLRELENLLGEKQAQINFGGNMAIENHGKLFEEWINLDKNKRKEILENVNDMGKQSILMSTPIYYIEKRLKLKK